MGTGAGMGKGAGKSRSLGKTFLFLFRVSELFKHMINDRILQLR